MPSDGQNAGSSQDYHLYAVSVGCPNCDEVTKFVEVTDAPVALDRDVPVDGKTHCPQCGVHLPSIGQEWDLQAEHEIEAVTPSQERDSRD